MMRLASTLAVLLLLIPACSGGADSGGGAEPGASEYRAPATESGEDGWEIYVDAPTLTPEGAAGVLPGGASPEAAVTHFYASRMRGDERWKDVVLPDPGKRMRRKLEEYDKWKFLEMRLVGRKPAGDDPDRLYIRIEMKIEYKGKVDGGTDEAAVKKIDGGWFVESVPT